MLLMRILMIQTIFLPRIIQKKLNEENTAAAVCDLDRILSANAVDCQGIPIGQIAQAKLEELQTEVDNISQMSESSRTMTFADRVQKIDPAIRESYSELGEVLCAYRCGKLPQLFNSLIHHAEWEDMLMLMTPEQWTPAAIKQATNLFSSTQCVDDMSQRFFNMILLPRCRDEIMQFKKLNVYLFDSVRAAVRRPAAFFKGIIIPLCESGTCTKLEASILSQIITSVKIPMLHASACILRIAEISPYNPAYTIFLRAFITKKYNLPYQVIDSLTYHFYNFINQTPEQISLLLLIWHESLLDFVSYYGQYLSVEQQQLLRDLLKKCKHSKFTPLIKEQLNRAACATDAAEQVGDVDSTRLKANYDMVDLNSSSGDESAPGEDFEA
ncbi:MAG: hypothetical protein MHMPM18_000444 [Marteilia pararefringens]